MDALTGSLLTRIGLALPAGRRGGPVGGNRTGDQVAFEKMFHPQVPWALLITLLVTLALVSAMVSMLAWSASRRHHDIRSLSRRTFH